MVLLALAAACGKPAAPSAPNGAQLFGAACARCHGADGGGGMGAGAPRNFHDAAFQAARTDAELRAVIRGGKAPAMPPFAAVFSEAELDALVAHIRTLDPRRHP